MKQLILLCLFSPLLSFTQIDDSCFVYLPNVLTPDCDWHPCDELIVYSTCQINNYNFKVYNRWGELMYESEDIEDVWIPSQTMKPLVDGTYVWVLTGEWSVDTDLDGDFEMTSFENKGHVTILR